MSAATTEAVETRARLNYLDPKTITVHPRNPRHRATADDELVTSIREHGLVQPLVVAVVVEPKPTGLDADGRVESSPGEYLLIGGHRRLAACKKARLKEIPCVVRRDLDTEALQVEAMILENSSRVDLTPVEEAEGYAALVELGHKQKDIARITGKSAKTVSERLRLLKLSKSTKDRVHKGQMTIDDANALIEFADDPATTKRLEQAAQGHDFKYQLQRARQHKKAEADVAGQVANLLAHGAHEITGSAPAGAVPTYSTFSRDPEDHPTPTGKGKTAKPGCRAFKVIPADTWNATRLDYYCLDPDSHAAQLDDEQKARQADDAARDAEREQRRADRAAARSHRVNTMTEHLGTNLVIPPQLVDLVRATLPAVFDQIDRYGDTVSGELYQELAGIVPADRWDGTTKKAERTKLLQHLDDVVTGEVPTGRVLIAVLLAIAELSTQDTTGRYDERRKATGSAAAAAYFETLGQLGHEWSPIDLELRAAHGHTKDETGRAS